MDLKILIVGSVNKHLSDYCDKYREVEVTEYVDDIDHIYQKAKVAIGNRL
jgi:UDP-N-acetylglucosamine:LPS N-acetylglucosamine transferase